MKKTLLLGALGLALALFVTLAPAPDASATTIIGHQQALSTDVINPSETSPPATQNVLNQATLPRPATRVLASFVANLSQPVTVSRGLKSDASSVGTVRDYAPISGFTQVVNTQADGTGTMAATSSGGTKAPVVADSNTGTNLDMVVQASAATDTTAQEVAEPSTKEAHSTLTTIATVNDSTMVTQLHLLAASTSALPTARAQTAPGCVVAVAGSDPTMVTARGHTVPYGNPVALALPQKYPNDFNLAERTAEPVATLNDGSALMASGHQSHTVMARIEQAMTTDIKGDRATSPDLALMVANPRHTRTVVALLKGGRKHCRDVAALAAMWPSGMSSA